jgi:hypothetical protein
MLNLNYTKIFAIIIILVIITFLALIFLPKPKSYYQPIETYKELLLLEKNTDIIKKEILDFTKKQNLNKHFDITIFKYKIKKAQKNNDELLGKARKNNDELLRKAQKNNDESNDKLLRSSDTDASDNEGDDELFFHDNIYSLSQTYNILQSIPTIKKISIVNLPPSYISINKKYNYNTTKTLECLFPVKCASNKKDHIWCDGEKRFFKESEIILFNNIREHQYVVKHKNESVLMLSVIIDNPYYLNYPGYLNFYNSKGFNLHVPFNLL